MIYGIVFKKYLCDLQAKTPRLFNFLKLPECALIYALILDLSTLVGGQAHRKDTACFVYGHDASKSLVSRSRLLDDLIVRMFFFIS
jgi:hypothetical protein